MKAVRAREENLDRLKHQRRNIVSKADAADKKLNKMSPENKNLQAQTDLLLGLRNQTRDLDAEILAEEASLGDFKREATRNWMTLKFGGLQELCEKGLVSQIPLRAGLDTEMILDHRRLWQADYHRATDRNYSAWHDTRLLPWSLSD